METDSYGEYIKVGEIINQDKDNALKVAMKKLIYSFLFEPEEKNIKSEDAECRIFSI